MREFDHSLEELIEYINDLIDAGANNENILTQANLKLYEIRKILKTLLNDRDLKEKASYNGLY